MEYHKCSRVAKARSEVLCPFRVDDAFGDTVSFVYMNRTPRELNFPPVTSHSGFALGLTRQHPTCRVPEVQLLCQDR